MLKLPNKPKLTDQELDKIVGHYFKSPPELLIVGVRGYFSKTIGEEGNDFNQWDDAFFIYENGTLIKSFNGNTDPTKLRKDEAQIKAGIYTFYKGVHNKRIKGLRAYPEGVGIPCLRQNAKGIWYDSIAHLINFHDNVGSTTGSEGCQTIPQPQFNEFRDLVYEKMTNHKLKVITYLLVEEPEMQKLLNNL